VATPAGPFRQSSIRHYSLIAIFVVGWTLLREFE